MSKCHLNNDSGILLVAWLTAGGVNQRLGARRAKSESFRGDSSANFPLTDWFGGIQTGADARLRMPRPQRVSPRGTFIFSRRNFEAGARLRAWVRFALQAGYYAVATDGEATYAQIH
jgi:hypothetical protein